MDHPSVFISYSHDSDEHKDRVHLLSEKLRLEGIDCHIDQYETSPAEGWPRWMRNRIREAAFVLVVCTETYERRFEGTEEVGRGAGAIWEGAIITQELYESEGRNTKFIPIAFSPEDTRHIPIEMRAGTWYIVDDEKGYEDLYRHLTNQPKTVKGPLGKQRSLPPLPRKQNFIAIAAEREPVEAAKPVGGPAVLSEKPRSLVLVISPEGHPLFFEAISVRSGVTIKMSIVSQDGRQTASLETLTRPNRRETLPIAFGTTATMARLNTAERVLEDNREVWHLEFIADDSTGRDSILREFSMTSHSPDEIAEMRARRILLDEKLPGSQYRGSNDLNMKLLEGSVQGVQTTIKVLDSPFPYLYPSLKDDIPLFLAAARLYGVLRLLLSNTVEHIHVLELTMRNETELSINFEGERPAHYSGQDPFILRVEGNCNLVRVSQ